LVSHKFLISTEYSSINSHHNITFTVAFGGIAGLFLGFSLLSGVEIIYYFTLRACCMVTNNSTVLEKLNEEYSHQDKPIVDLGLKPLWNDGKKETLIDTSVAIKNNGKNEVFVLPFLP